MGRGAISTGRILLLVGTLFFGAGYYLGITQTNLSTTNIALFVVGIATLVSGIVVMSKEEREKSEARLNRFMDEVDKMPQATEGKEKKKKEKKGKSEGKNKKSKVEPAVFLPEDEDLQPLAPKKSFRKKEQDLEEEETGAVGKWAEIPLDDSFNSIEDYEEIDEYEEAMSKTEQRQNEAEYAQRQEELRKQFLEDDEWKNTSNVRKNKDAQKREARLQEVEGITGELLPQEEEYDSPHRDSSAQPRFQSKPNVLPEDEEEWEEEEVYAPRKRRTTGEMEQDAWGDDEEEEWEQLSTRTRRGNGEGQGDEGRSPIRYKRETDLPPRCRVAQEDELGELPKPSRRALEEQEESTSRYRRVKPDTEQQNHSVPEETETNKGRESEEDVGPPRRRAVVQSEKPAEGNRNPEPSDFDDDFDFDKNTAPSRLPTNQANAVSDEAPFQEDELDSDFDVERPVGRRVLTATQEELDDANDFEAPPPRRRRVESEEQPEKPTRYRRTTEETADEGYTPEEILQAKKMGVNLQEEEFSENDLDSDLDVAVERPVGRRVLTATQEKQDDGNDVEAPPPRRRRVESEEQPEKPTRYRRTTEETADEGYTPEEILQAKKMGVNLQEEAFSENDLDSDLDFDVERPVGRRVITATQEEQSDAKDVEAPPRRRRVESEEQPEKPTRYRRTTEETADEGYTPEEILQAKKMGVNLQEDAFSENDLDSDLDFDVERPVGRRVLTEPQEDEKRGSSGDDVPEKAPRYRRTQIEKAPENGYTPEEILQAKKLGVNLQPEEDFLEEEDVSIASEPEPTAPRRVVDDTEPEVTRPRRRRSREKEDDQEEKPQRHSLLEEVKIPWKKARHKEQVVEGADAAFEDAIRMGTSLELGETVEPEQTVEKKKSSLSEEEILQAKKMGVDLEELEQEVAEDPRETNQGYQPTAEEILQAKKLGVDLEQLEQSEPMPVEKTVPKSETLQKSREEGQKARDENKGKREVQTLPKPPKPKSRLILTPEEEMEAQRLGITMEEMKELVEEEIREEDTPELMILRPEEKLQAQKMGISMDEMRAIIEEELDAMEQIVLTDEEVLQAKKMGISQEEMIALIFEQEKNVAPQKTPKVAPQKAPKETPKVAPQKAQPTPDEEREPIVLTDEEVLQAKKMGITQEEMIALIEEEVYGSVTKSDIVPEKAPVVATVVEVVLTQEEILQAKKMGITQEEMKDLIREELEEEQREQGVVETPVAKQAPAVPRENSSSPRPTEDASDYDDEEEAFEERPVVKPTQAVPTAQEEQTRKPSGTTRKAPSTNNVVMELLPTEEELDMTAPLPKVEYHSKRHAVTEEVSDTSKKPAYRSRANRLPLADDGKKSTKVGKSKKRASKKQEEPERPVKKKRTYRNDFTDIDTDLWEVYEETHTE